MPAKKLRVEIFDADGNRYTVSCEGDISREKVLRILDLSELLGGSRLNDDGVRSTSSDYTKFDLFRSFIKRSFPFEWFSSKEAQLACEDELNIPLRLSTVSTYLARMADRGFLMRKGPSNERKYKSPVELNNDETGVLKDNK